MGETSVFRAFARRQGPAPTLQYRARFAHQSSKVPPSAIYGQPCATVLAAVQAAPSNTLLVSLQKFLDTATGTDLYQAVWSTPIP